MDCNENKVILMAYLFCYWHKIKRKSALFPLTVKFTMLCFVMGKKLSELMESVGQVFVVIIENPILVWSETLLFLGMKRLNFLGWKQNKDKLLSDSKKRFWNQFIKLFPCQFKSLFFNLVQFIICSKVRTDLLQCLTKLNCY